MYQIHIIDVLFLSNNRLMISTNYYWEAACNVIHLKAYTCVLVNNDFPLEGSQWPNLPIFAVDLSSHSFQVKTLRRHGLFATRLVKSNLHLINMATAQGHTSRQ
jgi:hypothetical protein